MHDDQEQKSLRISPLNLKNTKDSQQQLFILIWICCARFGLVTAEPNLASAQTDIILEWIFENSSTTFKCKDTK